MISYAKFILMAVGGESKLAIFPLNTCFILLIQKLQVAV